MSLPGNINQLLIGAAASTGGAAAGPIKSVRFNDADSAYLDRTPSSASNRNTYTWSGWVKRCEFGTGTHYFFTAVDGSNVDILGIEADSLYWYNAYSGAVTSTDKFRDPSAWYHFVFSVDSTQATEADRVKLYVNNREITSFSSSLYPSLNRDFAINNTVVHKIGQYFTTNSSNFYLADVYFIDGQQLDPTSFGAYDGNGVWQAKDASGLTFGTNGFHLFDFANVSGIGDDSSGNENDWTVNNISTGDYSGTKPKWYTSTTLYTTKADVIANATDRGQDAFTLSSDEFVYLVPNDGGIAGELCHPVGSEYPVLFYVYVRSSGDTSWYNTGSFGAGEADTFQWENTSPSPPAAYDYTNTEDLYLIGDTRTAGQPDANSKLSGSFPALVNIVEETDVMRDVPTNGNSSDDSGAGGEVSGNYATLNTQDTAMTAGSVSDFVTNGNLTKTNVASTYGKTRATMPVHYDGKTYFEVTCAGAPDANDYIGFEPSDKKLVSESGFSSGDLGFRGNGTLSPGTTSYGAAWSDGDVLGFYFDYSNQEVGYYLNGVDQGVAWNSFDTTKYYLPTIQDWSNAVTGTFKFNFGQLSFAYSNPGTDRPSADFKPLCTTLITTPTIADGSDYFDVLTWTGDGSGSRSFTGLSFQPDFTWVKIRSLAYTHTLFDAVRGAGSNKELSSDSSGNEGNANTITSGYLSSFDTNGFSSTEGTLDNDYFNKSSNTYVAWNWDAGTSTVSNTDGTITSSVRANQTAGFSIVSYTGTGGTGTVGHGLNATPHLIIVKNRDETINWVVAHNALSSNRCLALNSTAADTTIGFTGLNKSNFTSSTFTVNYSDTNLAYVNASSDEYIAYCFAPVANYSQFSSYVGNGSADGTFVHTGFRPAWVLIKRTDTATAWVLFDSTRSPYNDVNEWLRPNGSDVEATNNNIDFLSNGFKLRKNDSFTNQNDKTFVYACFAENPFQANGGLAR